MRAWESKFEMGAAPYQYIGLWSAPSSALGEANPNAYNNAILSAPSCCRHCCDHCGAGIIHHHIIEDGNGDRFAVGSDCISNLNDQKLVDASVLAEKIRQRKIRSDAQDMMNEQRRIEHESEMQRQREFNDGLTDYEMNQQVQKAARTVIRDDNRAAANYFLVALESQNGGFCESVARDLIDGRIPSGRGLNILLEICAKYHSGAKQARGVKFEQELLAADARFSSLTLVGTDKDLKN